MGVCAWVSVWWVVVVVVGLCCERRVGKADGEFGRRMRRKGRRRNRRGGRCSKVSRRGRKAIVQ